MVLISLVPYHEAFLIAYRDSSSRYTDRSLCPFDASGSELLRAFLSCSALDRLSTPIGILHRVSELVSVRYLVYRVAYGTIVSYSGGLGSYTLF